MPKLYPEKESSRGLLLLYDAEVTEVGNKWDDSVIYTRTSMDGDDEMGQPTYPFLPVKYFHALPKKHDRVFVILKEYSQAGGSTQTKMKRYWIGPIEPQWETISGGSYNSKFTLEPDGPTIKTPPKKNINNNKSKTGVYPNKDEVAIHNGNTDVILSETQINIRAGKFIFGDRTKSKFNNKNQALINIKYGNSNIKENEEIIVKNIPVYIEPEYSLRVEIVVTDQGANVFGKISVIAIRDGVVVEETSEVNQQLLHYLRLNSNAKIPIKKRNLVIKRIKDYLKIYKRRYPKWAFSSNVPELSKERKYFRGHVTTVKKEERKQPKTITTGDGGGSVINVISNRINLISYDGINNYGGKILDNNKDISEKEQRKINADLQSIVYGERLLTFLRLVKSYVTTHIHPYPGLPPIQDNSVLRITEFNLDDLLNKNIKTN